MKIVTDQFGEIEFDENLIINFKDGIIGFENLKKFLLITEEDGLFYWLTSVEDPGIVFPLFPAAILEENYPAAEGYEGFGIVKLSKEISEITINLKAPVYINHEKKIGFQKIIDNDKFEIARKLFIETKSE